MHPILRLAVIILFTFNAFTASMRAQSTSIPLPPPHIKVLKKATIFNGVKFPAGTTVFIDNSGHMFHAILINILRNSKTINDITFPSGTKIYTDESGSMLGAAIMHDFKLSGLLVRKGAYIHFADGLIMSLTVGKNQKINGIILPIGSEVYFFDDGKIEGITTDKEMVINKTLFYQISYYPNGKLKSGFVRNNQIIEGLLISKTMEVGFDENGHVQLTPQMRAFQQANR
jgi:antitoxin component YwqK of YwqJK toxin-antitoxin module